MCFSWQLSSFAQSTSTIIKPTTTVTRPAASILNDAKRFLGALSLGAPFYLQKKAFYCPFIVRPQGFTPFFYFCLAANKEGYKLQISWICFFKLFHYDLKGRLPAGRQGSPVSSLFY
jgi:hypothetical protein